MKPQRTLRRLLAVAVVASGLILAGSPPASAHALDWPIRYGPIILYGSVKLDNAHRAISVCDKRRDDVGVYAEYRMRNSRGDILYDTVGDRNGNDDGCGHEAPPWGYYVIAFNGHSADGRANTGWITA